MNHDLDARPVIFFLAIALLQMTVLIAIFSIGIKTGDYFAIFYIAEAVLPLIGFLTVLQIKRARKVVDKDHKIHRSFFIERGDQILFAFFTWCCFSVVIHIVLVLLRMKVIPIPSNNTTQMIFGNIADGGDTVDAIQTIFSSTSLFVALILDILQILLQFTAAILTFIIRKDARLEQDEETTFQGFA